MPMLPQLVSLKLKLFRIFFWHFIIRSASYAHHAAPHSYAAQYPAYAAPAYTQYAAAPAYSQYAAVNSPVWH